MAVTLKGEDMRGETVEEPAIMGDDHGAARILGQRVFQCAERINVEIVGRLIEQDDVAFLAKHLRKVNAVALTTGKDADFFLLVSALEVECADVGT